MIRQIAPGPIQHYGSRLSIREIQSHRTQQIMSRAPYFRFGSRSPAVVAAAVAAAGVTGFLLNSWLYPSWESSHSERKHIKYADRETMVKVRSPAIVCCMG